ncbi:MAG TPA: aminomethyltransferase family protein [Candidatus Polarisedimenticolia bacterium]|nr:aminomethyltransferase family protein [Candidatus Polarisedimenticolia bacterium]
MPIGTAVHDRTLALCESLNYREWSGYFAVSSYEVHFHHEYNAIRNASALIDISPLFKYVVRGKDARRLIDRVVTRDMSRVEVGQMIYTPWCDEHGRIIDDGTVARLDDDVYRWTAADPTLRWIRENASGLDVEVEDVSTRTAALALQGPTSAAILALAADADIAALKYFRVARATIGGVPVEISRNGYTGDLGYEIWMPWEAALQVWDALMHTGRAYDLRAAGMLALDVARIEAGLLLIEVDYVSSRRATLEAQMSTPDELGWERLVSLDKAEPFVGRKALRELRRRGGPSKRLVGLELDWSDVERAHERFGLTPSVPAAASRQSVPVFRGERQIGKATSTTWSPTLKKMIALASVETPLAAPGTLLMMEVTVEAHRLKAGARVVPLPFFNPPRKTAVPAIARGH